MFLFGTVKWQLVFLLQKNSIFFTYINWVTVYHYFSAPKSSWPSQIKHTLIPLQVWSLLLAAPIAP